MKIKEMNKDLKHSSGTYNDRKTLPRPAGEGARRAGEGKDFAIADRATLVRNDVTTLVPQYLSALVPSKRIAFTLAEVLITLGIIGVVAAITMPVLIQTNNNRVVETRLKKFYSSINQVIMLAENEYGDRTEWFESDTDTQLEWLQKYFLPYMNNVKTVEKSGTTDNPYVTIYFADGSAVRKVINVSPDLWTFFPGNPDKCIKNKNNYAQYLGRCGFVFYYHPTSTSTRTFEPYGATSSNPPSDNTIKNHVNFGCNINNNTPLNWPAYCTLWIMKNGWKIPDDYPFKVTY